MHVLGHLPASASVVSTRRRDLVPRSRRLLNPPGPTRRARSSRVAARSPRASLLSRLIGPDVDAPAGEPGREAGVLALLADGQRQLEVGDDDARRAGLEVDDLDRAD